MVQGCSSIGGSPTSPPAQQPPNCSRVQNRTQPKKTNLMLIIRMRMMTMIVFIDMMMMRMKMFVEMKLALKKEVGV